MWCLKCLVEYREGFTVCSDCGSALVEESSKEMASALEEKQVRKRKAIRKFQQKCCLISAGFLAVCVVAILWRGFVRNQGIENIPVRESAPGESSVSESAESEMSEIIPEERDDGTTQSHVSSTASVAQEEVAEQATPEEIRKMLKAVPYVGVNWKNFHFSGPRRRPAVAQ